MVAAWKSLGFRSYDAYIKSRLWWKIRQLILERDGKCCQVCGTPSKIVHHIDYTEIIMLGQGNQHELITLCEPCHNFVEQEKNLFKKKSLLNKLFVENSPTTLDSWQIWAKTFNTDIGYDSTQILEPKNNSHKKRKKKKQKSIIVSNDTTTSEQPKTELESIRAEIDYYIKKHKKKKSYETLVYVDEHSKKEFITNTVRKYNKLRRKLIKKKLDNTIKPVIELLYNHPEANDKLKKAIYPYIVKTLRKNETTQQKRQRQEEQYQKKRERKKYKISSKLPNWTVNHKAKSFQGASPLSKYLSRTRQNNENSENASS